MQSLDSFADHLKVKLLKNPDVFFTVYSDRYLVKFYTSISLRKLEKYGKDSNKDLKLQCDDLDLFFMSE